MSSAENLLNEAQYAFASISFGESRSNSRNRSKAGSLARKILRKYPGTTEAREAHSILLRLGDEAYSSNLAVRHRHVPQDQHHGSPVAGPQAPAVRVADRAGGAAETLDWGGLIGLILTTPKAVLAAVAIAAFVLFSIFGPFLLVALIALVLFTGPFRLLLKKGQREQMNELVARINGLIRERRGLS